MQTDIKMKLFEIEPSLKFAGKNICGLKCLSGASFTKKRDKLFYHLLTRHVFCTHSDSTEPLATIEMLMLRRSFIITEGPEAA